MQPQLTPHKPLLKILKIDESVYWGGENDGVKRSFGVYAFDARSKTHLCEMTPSFTLHYVETQLEWEGDPDEKTRETAYALADEMDASSERIIYKHCHELDAAEEIKPGWFPDGVMGVYKWYMGYKQEEFDAQDAADKAYDEVVEDEWALVPPASAKDEEADKVVEAWKEAAEKLTDEKIGEVHEARSGCSL